MEQTTLQRRVRVIPATVQAHTAVPRGDGKQRVAAYCRVSTNSEERHGAGRVKLKGTDAEVEQKLC